MCRIEWIECRLVKVGLVCERLWNETDPIPALLGSKVGNPLKELYRGSGEFGVQVTVHREKFL